MCPSGPLCSMASPDVGGVLERAAKRAERLAALDHAQGVIERELKFPHPPETLPWGDVLSKSYLLIKSPNHCMMQTTRMD